MSIKVGIIEDNPYIREFIVDFLKEDKELACVAEAECVEDFFSDYSIREMDVLLQDISLPGMTGIEAIRLVKQKFNNISIIMFTIHDDPERIFKALCAGATGYLLKNTALPKIKESILQVHRGEAAMSPSIAKKVVDYFCPAKNISHPLTKKEQQIVACMVDGMSYKMIADHLIISMNTLRYHIRNIYKKLEVNSKSEVVTKSLRGEI